MEINSHIKTLLEYLQEKMKNISFCNLWCCNASRLNRTVPCTVLCTAPCTVSCTKSCIDCATQCIEQCEKQFKEVKNDFSQQCNCAISETLCNNCASLLDACNDDCYDYLKSFDDLVITRQKTHTTTIHENTQLYDTHVTTIRYNNKLKRRRLKVNLPIQRQLCVGKSNKL